MKVIQALKRLMRNSDTTAGRLGHIGQRLDETVAGLDNQSRLLNQKFQELIEASINQSRLLDDKLMAMVQRQEAMMELQKAEVAAIRDLIKDRGTDDDLSAIQVPPVPTSPIAPA